jgi:hypothetical protein
MMSNRYARISYKPSRIYNIYLIKASILLYSRDNEGHEELHEASETTELPPAAYAAPTDTPTKPVQMHDRSHAATCRRVDRLLDAALQLLPVPSYGPLHAPRQSSSSCPGLHLLAVQEKDPVSGVLHRSMSARSRLQRWSKRERHASCSTRDVEKERGLRTNFFSEDEVVPRR